MKWKTHDGEVVAGLGEVDGDGPDALLEDEADVLQSALERVGERRGARQRGEPGRWEMRWEATGGEDDYVEKKGRFRADEPCGRRCCR